MTSETHAAAYGANIDDTARAVLGQIFHGSLDEKEWSEHIDLVLVFEVLNGARCDFVVDRDTSVVDDNVNLEFSTLWVGEVILDSSDDMLWTTGTGHICLNAETLNSIGLLQLGLEFLGLWS